MFVVIRKEKIFDDYIERELTILVYSFSLGELAPLKRAQIPSLNPLVTLDTASPSSELVKRLSAPRQRIEILSWPPTNDTSKNLYKWKYYLVNNVHSSTHFFHIVQLFSRTLGGFVIALGLQNGRLVISDNVRPNCGGICPSIPLTEVWGKTLYHRMLVTWGPQGSIECECGYFEVFQISRRFYPDDDDFRYRTRRRMQENIA